MSEFDCGWVQDEVDEICKNCWHYNEDTGECQYYEYDKFKVNGEDECQITHSKGCFESR